MSHPEPVDPFLGDAEDPVHELDALDDPDDDEYEDEDHTPITAEELLEELEEIDMMETHLTSKGIRGLSMHCPDCDVLHYFDWELMRASARHIAEFGEPRVHEPAISPNEDEYVPYAYARGYLDAIIDASLTSDESTALSHEAEAEA